MFKSLGIFFFSFLVSSFSLGQSNQVTTNNLLEKLYITKTKLTCTSDFQESDGDEVTDTFEIDLALKQIEFSTTQSFEKYVMIIDTITPVGSYLEIKGLLPWSDIGFYQMKIQNQLTKNKISYVFPEKNEKHSRKLNCF